MAKSILVSLNLNGNEIQNVRAHVLANAPASPASGQFYFNSTDHKLYYYNGTEWVDLTSSANSYGSVKVGATTIEADSASDMIEIVAGENVTLTPDAANGKVTITAEDTTYDPATPSTSGVGGSAGLMSASDKEKLNGIEEGAEANVQADWEEDDTASDAYIANKPDLGDAAAKGVSTDVESDKTSDAKLPTAKAVADYVGDAIAASDAMVFKGTIGTGGDVTTLPTSGVHVGDTYRVITAGTYAGETCEIGDLIIALTETPTWTVAQTNIDGAITGLTEGTGIDITGSGSTRTIALESGVATAGSAGDTAAQTPAFGGTFKAVSATVDEYGRVTALADHNVTIPDTKASASNFGLMKVGEGLSAAGGVVSSDILSGTASIAAGSTSASAAVTGLIAYKAFDASTGEEVMIDAAQGASSVTFSIASAYTNAITINYTYAA